MTTRMGTQLSHKRGAGNGQVGSLILPSLTSFEKLADVGGQIRGS